MNARKDFHLSRSINPRRTGRIKDGTAEILGETVTVPNAER